MRFMKLFQLDPPSQDEKSLHSLFYNKSLGSLPF